MVSIADLSQLQNLLLLAVLLGTPLPGSTQPVRLPDLTFVLGQPSIILLDQNLSKPISLGGAPKPLRVMSVDELRKHAEQQGDTAYLMFEQPEQEGGDVRMTLSARIATREPTSQALGLSSIRVQFRKVGGEWRLVDEPIYSAS